MELKTGDVVTLKSGSPSMTIEGIGKYDFTDEEKALCSWFDGNRKMQDKFILEALEKTE